MGKGEGCEALLLTVELLTTDRFCDMGNDNFSCISTEANSRLQQKSQIYDHTEDIMSKIVIMATQMTICEYS